MKKTYTFGKISNSNVFHPVPSQVRLSPNVRLRKEYFGGLVFDTVNGNILEVDKDVYTLLQRINGCAHRVQELFVCFNRSSRTQKTKFRSMLNTLFKLNIIEEDTEPITAYKSLCGEPDTINRSWVRAPETVHWAVTYRCDDGCPDCYIARFSGDYEELSTEKACRMLDRIADWGVFELALGGGEPFMRNDLPQLINYAAGTGLAVHLTTGNIAPNQNILNRIHGSLKVFQIGIKPALLLSDEGGYRDSLKKTVSAVQDMGSGIGANLYLSSSVQADLEESISRLLDTGLRRIVLLRYKPPNNRQQWRNENPQPWQMSGLYNRILGLTTRYPELTIRLDCSLGFVNRGLPSEVLKENGVKGCVAADRIVAAAPDGSIYPCSQLVYPEKRCGSLLDNDLQNTWDTARNLKRYRYFRSNKSFKNSWCGVCRMNESCGGCRVFADDGIGGDPGCPEPLVPVLTELGKTGRKLDLEKFLRINWSISVQGFMARYGVSQRTAIKELHNCRFAVSASGKPARAKNDTFTYIDDDIVLEVQNSIGHTSGGLPYATYEQVAEWIGVSRDDYPEWLIETDSQGGCCENN